MKHKLFSRFTSVLLAVVMLAGLMGTPSLATDNVLEGDSTAVTGEQIDDTADASSQDQSAETVADGTEEEKEGSETSTDESEANDSSTQELADNGDTSDGVEAVTGTYGGMTAAELTDAIMACQSVDEAKALVAKLTEEEK